MKIIFIGTSNISRVSLEALLKSDNEMLAVITQPDKSSGRGRKIVFSPVKEAALAAGLKIMQPEKIGAASVLNELREMSPDIFVLVSYAQMIPKALCDIAPHGCINMHPSLLPKYRGAGPIRGPILNGDTVGGVSVMQIAEKMDSGDVFAQREIAIPPRESLSSYEEKASTEGAGLLIEVLKDIETGKARAVPQDDSQATYLSKIEKKDGLIDFSKSAVQIERQIRACDPWPSAFTYLEGKMFKIWDAEVIDEEAEGQWGNIVNLTKRSFMIKTKEGLLKPGTVQIEGKKKMSCEEFLRGFKLKEDTYFGK